ncbi:uncharacterized protein TNCV_1862821 [Trichonephila clavipes]|nr:uncharacterized protein TNCV_1862821 [Trichonephila clavipes]
MPRSQKVFKKRKGKYYRRKNIINSKVSTTDSKLNAQAEHAHESKQSCAKEKKIPNLNESFSSFGDSVGIINAIMNLNILAFVFKNEVHCKMCNSSLDMQVLKGKVIDVDILSKYCTCRNLPFHEKDCKRNCVGSSGAMEIQCASKIFQRSLSLHDARYIAYLGDGDYKAFDAVKKKTFMEINIQLKN